MNTRTAVQERKQQILAKMRKLQRPIWVADVAVRVSDQEAYGRAFRELAADGIIEGLPRPRGTRAYYRLKE